MCNIKRTMNIKQNVINFKVYIKMDNWKGNVKKGGNIRYNATDNQTPQEVDSIIEDFVSKTTLPGVSHICKRSKIAWKLFWFVVSTASTSMAIYQSWPILKDFIEGRTTQSTTYYHEFDFPSVTICSNIRLNSNYTDYFTYEEKNVSPDSLINVTDFVELVQKRRFEIDDPDYPLIKSFKPIHCTYNRKHCDLSDEYDLYNFQTAYFGKCTTFNIGTTVNKKVGRYNNNLNIKFKLNFDDHKLDFNENYLQVWLHPAGAAPVLYQSEGLRVYPGDILDIRMEMKKIKRLPRRHNKCLHPYKDAMREQSIFYSNDTRYIYSTKACLYSFLFETKKNIYKCLDPAVPQNEVWENLWKTNLYNICSPGNFIELPPNIDDDDGNETEFYSLFNFDNNCSLPCYEWMIEYSSTSTSLWFEKMIAASLKSDKSSISRKNQKATWEINDLAEIKVSLGSALVEVVTEDYRYLPGDFAGIIGGNVGFWIGVCAISLAEIIELVITLITNCWKRNKNQDTKRPTKIIHIKTNF